MAARRKNARKGAARKASSKRTRASERPRNDDETMTLETRSRVPFNDENPRRGPEYEKARRERDDND